MDYVIWRDVMLLLLNITSRLGIPWDAVGLHRFTAGCLNVNLQGETLKYTAEEGHMALMRLTEELNN